MPRVKAWRAFMVKYAPEGDLHNANYVNAYNSAMALEAVLKACGDDLVDRQHPEAGLFHQGPGTADAAARHPDQHFADRSRAGRPDAVHALQWQELGRFGDLQTGN